jgi:hypothetical protein
MFGGIMRKSMLAAGFAVVAAVAATVVGMTVALAANSAPMIQHITALSTRANGMPIVIARGPIHARGRDVVVSNSVDRFVFPNGTLRIRHHRIGKGVNTVDPVTCYATHRERGAYAIVGGTGAYRGTSGKGIYHLRVQIVGCHPHKPPRLFMLIIKASGPLHP